MGINNRQMSNVRETRPDTRLTQSRVGGQGPYFRSPDHLGRTDQLMDGQTDGWMDKAGCRVEWHATKNENTK